MRYATCGRTALFQGHEYRVIAHAYLDVTEKFNTNLPRGRHLFQFVQRIGETLPALRDQWILVTPNAALDEKRRSEAL